LPYLWANQAKKHTRLAGDGRAIMMGFVDSVGKNKLNQTISEGTFTEVKLIVNIRTLSSVTVNRSSTRRSGNGDQQKLGTK
jgi:hypothetical protein